MPLRDLGFYLRGRINSTLTRAINARRARTPLRPVARVDEVVRGEPIETLAERTTANACALLGIP